MSIDRKTAKALCNADEFKLYEMSQPAKLKRLTQVELRNLVVRSRTLRNKWTDVSRGQRRASQSAKGARQNDENARSKQKAELFSEIHNAFVNFQKSVEAGEATLASGSKPVNVPRQDRKIVNRAVRSIVQDKLDQKKVTINRSKRASEGSAVKSAKPKPASSKAKTASSPTGPATATTDADANSTTGAKTARKIKPAASSAAKKKKPAAKVPRVSTARKKALAKRAEVAAVAPKKSVSSKATRGPEGSEIPKAATSARNRSMHAKATAGRVARGGATRIQGHVSAKGKRSQARRDSKG